MSSTDPAIRVGRTEREAAIDRLQAAYADGQIDDTELSDRTNRALQARVRGDLDSLLADIPAPRLERAPAQRPRTGLGHCVDCCVGFVVGICRAVGRLGGGGAPR